MACGFKKMYFFKHNEFKSRTRAPTLPKMAGFYSLYLRQHRVQGYINGAVGKKTEELL